MTTKSPRCAHIDSRLPRLLPEDVALAPELLVLPSLETVLGTLHVALVAAFPELLSDDLRFRDSPALRAARRLVNRAASLHQAVVRYRRALESERLPDVDIDDLPF